MCVAILIWRPSSRGSTPLRTIFLQLSDMYKQPFLYKFPLGPRNFEIRVRYISFNFATLMTDIITYLHQTLTWPRGQRRDIKFVHNIIVLVYAAILFDQDSFSPKVVRPVYRLCDSYMGWNMILGFAVIFCRQLCVVKESGLSLSMFFEVCRDLVCY